MLKHGFSKPNFKIFMANNAQTNWNVVIIVYGLRVLVKMVDKELTCLFHWIQSFDKHIKQLIKPELQHEHKAVCQQYKNATSLGDVDSHYALIHCWWFSYGVVFEASVHKLNNWLNFWHFLLDNGEVYVPREYFFCELLMISLFKTIRYPFSLNFHLQSIYYPL